MNYVRKKLLVQKTYRHVEHGGNEFEWVGVGWKSVRVDGGGLKMSGSGLTMSGNEWEWVRVDSSGWQWVGVDGSGWKWVGGGGRTV